METSKLNEVWIKPYVDTNIKRGGLENNNSALHDGAKHVEYLWEKDVNGLVYYVNGLNEYAPEVQGLDEDAKVKKIEYIRTTISELEKQMISNSVKIDDEDFWDKVKVLKPGNKDYWGKLKLELGNKPIVLTPKTNPEHRLLLEAIKAKGFQSVASSLEEVMGAGNKFRWYLSNPIETAAVKTSGKKLQNKALAELQIQFDKNGNKLKLIAKCLDTNSTRYVNSTPLDDIYDRMDDYIKGSLIKGEKEKLAQLFLDHCKMTIKDLTIKAVVKDAMVDNIINLKPDGYLHHIELGIGMGKNVDGVINFLSNPSNDDVYAKLKREVELKWNR